MAAERTGCKILVGCVGLAAISCFMCCGVATIWVPGALREIREKLTTERQRMGFASDWVPPPVDARDDRLFPVEIADYRRLRFEGHPELDEPPLGLEGRLVLYGRAGQRVEVFVCRATTDERGQAVDRLKRSLENAGGSRRVIQMPHRFSYAVRPPRQAGVLWWAQGWLFLFRTTGEADVDGFADDYLVAIQGGPTL